VVIILNYTGTQNTHTGASGGGYGGQGGSAGYDMKGYGSYNSPYNSGSQNTGSGYGTTSNMAVSGNWADNSGQYNSSGWFYVVITP